jgi:transcriptional regulator with XRE-family HTH domain
MVIMEAFGKRLAIALDLGVITRPELVKRLGVDASTVGVWLHDERPIASVNGKHLRGIARECKVEIGWLIDGEGEPRPPIDSVSFDEFQQIKAWRELSSDEKLALNILTKSRKP